MKLSSNQPESTPAAKPHDPPRPRDIKQAAKHGGFMWAQKAALERIRSCESFTTLYAVYHALCEIASDEGSKDQFKASFDRIGAKCGLTRRTVGPLIDVLEDIGLLSITRSSALKMPHTYQLLHCEVASHRSAEASQRCEDTSQRCETNPSCQLPTLKEKKEREEKGEMAIVINQYEYMNHTPLAGEGTYERMCKEVGQGAADEWLDRQQKEAEVSAADCKHNDNDGELPQSV